MPVRKTEKALASLVEKQAVVLAEMSRTEAARQHTIQVEVAERGKQREVLEQLMIKCRP